jgi:tRNA (cmo5U34)-methyltransferase
MTEQTDTNAVIWQSETIVEEWKAQAAEREQRRAVPLRLLAELLPFDADESFVFLDLGAGTGAASRSLLQRYSHSEGILADFSEQMMSQGVEELREFEGRYRYVVFDLATPAWPAEIPSGLDAVITSLCVHHLADARKAQLFKEIFERLSPGSWYLNLDPVAAPDAIVEATWERANDRLDPEAAHRRQHRTPAEQARWENHVRYLAPLEPQLGYLRDAGFEGVDVYWKHLENVVFGGRRPL